MSIKSFFINSNPVSYVVNERIVYISFMRIVSIERISLIIVEKSVHGMIVFSNVHGKGIPCSILILEKGSNRKYFNMYVIEILRIFKSKSITHDTVRKYES